MCARVCVCVWERGRGVGPMRAKRITDPKNFRFEGAIVHKNKNENVRYKGVKIKVRNNLRLARKKTVEYL